jgi:hypothetical protein
MTDQWKDTRDAMLARFAEHAAEAFAAVPARRSLLLAVAQYWDDSANDEVHGHVIASSRATPVWPHECDYDSEPSKPVLAGEECSLCGKRDIEMSFYGGYNDAMVGAFETFCREHAHQGMDEGEAYLPYAIARRIGDGVAIELVGHAYRPPTTTIGSPRLAAPWPDDRARALFDDVCLHADDDAPRAVLADYMLEAYPADPRGEAIALALADLDTAGRARRDALFVEHAERWMFPLGDVIAPGCAHFERGFLARADVYAANDADRDRVASSPAWGTVHTIRFTLGSRDVIGPTMQALRDVGPLRDAGIAAIARARRPWAIETLRIADGELDPLVRATSLPHLGQLELSSAFDSELPVLTKAPWWPTLRHLAIVGPDYGSLADWRARRAELGVRELSIAISTYWNPLASSWQLGFTADDRVVVRSAGWSGSATLLRLAELLGELPQRTPIALESTPLRTFTDDDATWLRDYTGRTVAVA